MYATRKLPGSLDGIESLTFGNYWNAIKSRINDLQQLPMWATQHAMKLGIVVSKLQAAGRQDLIDGMKLEILKVNDDIAKAWKVKGYIDKWLPQWMQAAVAQAGGVPIVASPAFPAGPVAPPPVRTAASFGIRQEAEEYGPGAMRNQYVAPGVIDQATGWVKSLFGLSGYEPSVRQPYDRGLGFVLPIVAVAVSIPALAYCVTTGMALYQDYSTKKDLTADVILGKLTSGQAKDILMGSRPAEGGMFSNIATGIGVNVGTMAVVGIAGYLAFMYFTAPKRGE